MSRTRERVPQSAASTNSSNIATSHIAATVQSSYLPGGANMHVCNNDSWWGRRVETCEWAPRPGRQTPVVYCSQRHSACHVHSRPTTSHNSSSSVSPTTSSAPPQTPARHTQTINKLPYIHAFNSTLSGTTRVRQYQKGQTNLDSLEQETESGSGISCANLHLASNS